MPLNHQAGYKVPTSKTTSYKSYKVPTSKISQKALSSSFSVFHNVISLKGNLENLQTHLLEELEFHFDVLGISETKKLPIQM